jgi:hypothetical protein
MRGGDVGNGLGTPRALMLNPAPALTDRDRAAAATLAEEVRVATGRRRTWRRVTTLLDHFGVNHLTTEARARIAHALAEAGIDVEPSIAEVQRYGTVRLSLAGDHSPPDHGGGDSPFEAARAMLRATLWQQGELPERLELEEATRETREEGVYWFDIDASRAEADVVHAVLKRVIGPEVTLLMVEDLLTADPLPRIEDYEEGGSIRLVSAVGVRAEEASSSGSEEDTSKAGVLVFQLVEILASDAWLVTCWHKPKVTRSGVDEAEIEFEAHEEFEERAGQRWARRRGRTAGDLGLTILYELTRSTSARRSLYAWFESWELEFYRRLEDTETTTLVELRGLIAAMRKRLNALHQPGMKEHPELVWFRGATDLSEAERVDDFLDRALRDLRALGEMLLGSINLHATLSSARQSHQAERFQKLVGLVAAILLVPTLVATVFGANTSVPGERRWTGFLLMMSLMLATAAVTLLALRRWDTRETGGGGTGERLTPQPAAGMAPKSIPATTAPSTTSAVTALYEHLAPDVESRTLDLLRIFATHPPLTPEEIAKRLTPYQGGVMFTKQQARAVLRNLSRAQTHLRRIGKIDRDVLVKDFSRYEEEGAGRYGLSDADREALRRHLGAP